MRILVGLLVFFSSVVSALEDTIHLYLAGPGLVGREVLRQIEENFSPDSIRVVGLANSQKMVFDRDGIALQSWKELLEGSNEAMSLERWIERMREFQFPHSVFVDCTSNQSVADAYEAILQSKISIVTPNKKANSGFYSTYCKLKDLAVQNQVHFLYDANVGAGLPIIRTIQSMKRSGDSIVKIEAILSGTLSYLFNTFDGAVPFSEVVRQAQAKGYTEPDPRDDLNGMDMARKFLILAREAGLDLEMGDVVVERFLPEDCFEANSVSEFYERLSQFDGTFSGRVKEQEGKVFRFIGTLENGRASLSLKAVGPEHPFYSLTDTNNIASIQSTYYCKNPIVIKGPGAGATVTAASVLSNVIECCE